MCIFIYGYTKKDMTNGAVYDSRAVCHVSFRKFRMPVAYISIWKGFGFAMRYPQ